MTQTTAAALDAPLVRLEDGPVPGVVEIVLNRPDRMNAINVDLVHALIAAGEEAFARPGLRAVILRGEGRAFCAGLDRSGFEKMMKTGAGSMGADIMERTHGIANPFQQVCRIWYDAPVPVIAAIHGHCLGGGLQIAIGADVRIAAPGTKLSIMELKWGLVPDMGGMPSFARLLRPDVLRRLVFTAEVIEAEAAQPLGLVTEIAEDPLARARALAEEITGRSPSAIRAAKELILLTEHADDAEVLLAESRLQKGLIGGSDQVEAVMAGMQNRPARFA